MLWKEYLQYKEYHPDFEDTVLCKFKEEIIKVITS
jgi:hypothetical protein